VACGLPRFVGFLAYFKMMPKFIRRMLYSGTVWQVDLCHMAGRLLHYLVFDSRAYKGLQNDI